MASDQRDWYLDWWRKRLGYVERSAFRLGDGEKRQLADRLAWRQNLIAVAMVVFTVVMIKILKGLGMKHSDFKIGGEFWSGGCW